MEKLPRHLRPNPAIIRSRLVLELASGLVESPEWPLMEAKVLLRGQGQDPRRLCVFGSGTIQGVHAVVGGDADLAITNPASSLALAYRGRGIFKSPQPVRTIGVIPSHDRTVFAVRRETGLTSVEDIKARRYPLRISLRGQYDHWVHPMLDDIMAAAGFSLKDLEEWGGEVRKEGSLPYPDRERFKALVNGDVDAIFDESAGNWCNQAAEAGMSILPMSEETVRRLEDMGYRRSLLRRGDFPALPQDILTLDFSGWPIFVHAEAPDALVRQMCEILAARKDAIPWQGVGAFPVERMVREAPETPQDVPFHPAAENLWREKGFI